MAVVGATLFGLIFLAISISPENITTSTASLDRQIRATAAYVALLNPLMISLFALVPFQWIGIAASALSWVGILNTVAMSVTLLRNQDQQIGKARSIVLIVVSLILYGLEAIAAIQITRAQVDYFWLNVLADLLIFITLFGVVRAWELIGIRHFRIRDWLTNLLIKLQKEGDKSVRKQPDE